MLKLFFFWGGGGGGGGGGAFICICPPSGGCATTPLPTPGPDSRPTTNIIDSAGNVLLHVNTRYLSSNEKYLVLNSNLNGAWGFPFDAAAVVVVVVVETDGYRVIANGGKFSYLYKHRKAASDARKIEANTGSLQFGLVS